MFARKGPALRTALILFLAVAGVSAAANLHRSVLSNHDVVTLAKAGFDEEFLVNLIVSSRTHFDTSPDAVAALAEQGVTQRIVEVMMNPGAAITTAGGVTVSAVAVTSVPVVKISPATLAIKEKVDDYEWKSVLGSLWKKIVGVGAPRPEESSCLQKKDAQYDVAR
jgi:hypothetical protein